jgi:hypothetical protein
VFFRALLVFLQIHSSVLILSQKTAPFRTLLITIYILVSNDAIFGIKRSLFDFTTVRLKTKTHPDSLTRLVGSYRMPRSALISARSIFRPHHHLKG